MATTWARAEVILDANGELLPAQVRREATRAGNEGGDAASSSFASAFRRSITPRLRGVFSGIGQSLRNMGNDADGANTRMNTLGTSLRRTLFRFGNTVPMLRFRLSLMDIGEAGKRAFKSIGDELDLMGQRMEETRRRGENQMSMWHRLSANTRQWTLIIGAVIASMSELAGLASAAGSGLFTLGGGIVGAVTGLGVLITAFAVFSRDIEDLPEVIRPARAAMSRLGDAFKDLGDDIAISVFQDTEDVFDSLRDTVKALTPAFQTVGRVINKVFRDFATNIAPGTKTFQNLSGMIEKSGPIFDSLLRSVGKLGDGLLAAFNNPQFQRAIQQMLDYVDTLFTRFSDFLQGPGFEEWLRHGEDIFGAFGELLDTTGRLLNDMVTDETVARLVEFIDNIDRFLQGGGKGILDFAQELDIFGIIAQALAEFGDALEPLHEPMRLLGEAIRQVFDAGITTLGPIIEDIATALAPMVTAFATFVSNNPQLVADGLIAIAAAFVIMKGAQGIAGLAGLMGTFIGKMDDATVKAPLWKSTIVGAIAGITAAFILTPDQQVSISSYGTNVTSAFAFGILSGGGLPVAAIAAVFALLWTAFMDGFDGEGSALAKTAVGAFFVDWNARIFAGMLGAVAIVANAFIFLYERFSLGWQQIVDFFTVSVPAFFAGWNGRIFGGFAQIASVVIGGFNDVKGRFQLGWQQIVDFFTNAVPGFFDSAVSGISRGVGRIAAAFDSAFPGVASVIRYWTGVIGDLVDAILSALGQAQSAAGQASSFSAGGGGGGGGFLAQASGGIHYGPTRVLMGEAGPEAIVPLNRALSQVDPSVRWLSAIAQGKGGTPMASGGIVGGGRTFTVEQINITETNDGRRTANDVITRIAEFVNG